MHKQDRNEFEHEKVLAGGLKSYVFLVLIGLSGLMSGCASTACKICEASQPDVQAPQVSVQTPQVIEQTPTPFHSAQSAEIKITAIGYGATSNNDSYTPGQKKLMAMRASKLDAYRALAEQVQGVRVNGNSTVSAMMAQVDGFRVFVDAYLRGAQVITVVPMADGNYETTLELTLDSKFFNSIPQQARGVPAPTVVGSNIKGSVGAGAAYGTNFYYTE